MAKDLRKHLKPGAQGRGYGANPGGGGGGHKKKGCCSMVAAVRSVKRGQYKLARRYAVMSIKLIIKKAGPLVAAVALLIAGIFVGATPASAASQGPAGYLTFWDGCNGGSNPTAGYCGATWALTASGGIGVCHALPTGAANRPSAFDNETGHNFRVWTGSGCTGSSATLFNGTETGQLDSPYDNNIESQQRIS